MNWRLDFHTKRFFFFSRKEWSFFHETVSKTIGNIIKFVQKLDLQIRNNCHVSNLRKRSTIRTIVALVTGWEYKRQLLKGHFTEKYIIGNLLAKALSFISKRKMILSRIHFFPKLSEQYNSGKALFVFYCVFTNKAKMCFIKFLFFFLKQTRLQWSFSLCEIQ